VWLFKQKWGKNDTGASQHIAITAAEKSTGSGKPANRHLIAEDAISVQKTIGNGEFGVVQQAIWTNEHGQRVSVVSTLFSHLQ